MHDDWKQIRDHLMDRLEKLGVFVTMDTGWMYTKQAFPLWIIILRRNSDLNSFAEVHLLSDWTIDILRVPSSYYIKHNEHNYHISNPDAFNNIISKAKDLLQEAVDEARHMESYEKEPYR